MSPFTTGATKVGSCRAACNPTISFSSGNSRLEALERFVVGNKASPQGDSDITGPIIEGRRGHCGMVHPGIREYARVYIDIL